MVATRLATCTQFGLTIPLLANWLTYVLPCVLRGVCVKETVLLIKPAEESLSVCKRGVPN